jgi:glycine hydroxymethyltransferase
MHVIAGKALADMLIKRGLRIVSGRTESHVMLVDLRPRNRTGKEAEANLARVREQVSALTVRFQVYR